MSLKHMQDLIEVAKKWRDEGKTRFHATGHSPEKIIRDMRRKENYAKGLTAHGEPRKRPLQTTGRAAMATNSKLCRPADSEAGAPGKESNV